MASKNLSYSTLHCSLVTTQATVPSPKILNLKNQFQNIKPQKRRIRGEATHLMRHHLQTTDAQWGATWAEPTTELKIHGPCNPITMFSSRLDAATIGKIVG